VLAVMVRPIAVPVAGWVLAVMVRPIAVPVAGWVLAVMVRPIAVPVAGWVLAAAVRPVAVPTVAAASRMLGTIPALRPTLPLFLPLPPCRPPRVARLRNGG
jgi:hypothetical protein